MYHFLRCKDLPYLLLVMVTGSLNHFLYEYSGNHPAAALIAPINESVWEHMKLLFFPFLFFSLIEYAIRRPNPVRFFQSRLIGVWSGILFIILFFYGYSYLLGTNNTIIDILLFFIGVILSFWISKNRYPIVKIIHPTILMFLWMLSIFIFFSFTYFPPSFSLFQPPV